MEVTSSILPSYIADKATPSQQDGISPEVEKIHRVYGCELVVQGGTILKLPQVVMVTGQNILNRFFYRKSLKRFDVFSIAMGSLLLASKVEECFKTLREVLFAFHHIYARRKGLQLKPMELGGQQYTAWKNELIMIERYILKELGFSLYNIMDHPHKYILYFIKVLNGSEDLANVAWRYLNDSMRLDISLRFEAQTIACAAIFLAARQVAFPLPEDAETGVWWEVFGASTEQLNVICSEIMGLYSNDKLTWLEPIAEVEYLSPENCAKFDALLADEEIAAAAPTSASYASEVSNIEPFADRKSSSSRTKDASTGDGTPRADDGDRSLTSTPVLNSYSSRADLGAAEEQGGRAGEEATKPRKLERKWMSVVGDIDQLDAAPAPTASSSSAATAAALAPVASSSRSLTDRRESQREHSRSREPRARADSRDRRRDRSREKGRDSRSAQQSRGESRPADSRERGRRGDSRDRRQDRDSRAAGGRDGRARDPSRDRESSRKDGERRGALADSRDRGGDFRRRDSERGRSKDRDGYRDRGDKGDRRDDDRDGRRKRSRSRSASPARRRP